MTLDEISYKTFELTKTRPSIEIFSDACRELGRHEILNIQFKEGGCLNSRPHVGHLIEKVWF